MKKSILELKLGEEMGRSGVNAFKLADSDSLSLIFNMYLL